MDFLAPDMQGERARIDWLIRLRWVAVLGVLGVVVAAGPLLGALPSCQPFLILVGFLAAWNLWLFIRVRSGRSVQGAGQQVIVDLLVLGALLFFSHGLRNPFSIFIAVQVILGAILLPRATALNVGMAGAGIAVALAVLDWTDLLPHQGDSDWNLPVWSVSLALVITIAVSLHLTVMIMEDLRNRTQESLRHKEAVEGERRKLFDVVRFVGASMVLLDHDLRTQWQNRRAEEALGRLPVGQAFGLPGLDAFPDPAALESGTTLEDEWTGPDEHGHPRVHHVTASPVRGRDGNLEQVILVFTDITDRRAAERQLQRTEKLAALGRLVAGVAHEINTPLGSMSILTSEAKRLLQSAVPLDDDRRLELTEHLEDIRGETERVANLVRRLLDLGHPGSEAEVAADLNLVVEDAVRLISMRSPRSRQRIKVSLGSGMEDVTTRPDRLRQVLFNILDNALDATRKQGSQVLVLTAIEDDHAVIEVTDDGEGIRDEDLQRVFDPFFTTKDVGEGTGLGLYVSYEIMKNLGGDIIIESHEGEGTRVRMTLPLHDRRDSATAGDSSSRHAAARRDP